MIISYSLAGALIQHTLSCMYSEYLHSSWMRNLNVIFCFLLFVGCSCSSQPQFKLDTEGRDPESISRDQAETIARILAKLFGTPDRPTIPQGVQLRLDLLNLAAGPMGSSEGDRAWGLYRKHCVVCHGISGDGAGPNAA